LESILGFPVTKIELKLLCICIFRILHSFVNKIQHYVLEMILVKHAKLLFIPEKKDGRKEIRKGG